MNGKKKKGKSTMQKLSFFFLFCYYYLKVLKLQQECATNRICKTTREREEKRKKRKLIFMFETSNNGDDDDDSPKTRSHSILLDYLSPCPVTIRSSTVAHTYTYILKQSCKHVENTPREIRLVLAIRCVVRRHTRQFYGFYRYN